TGTTSAMMGQSSSLAKLQNQIALGTRVKNPAGDPIAAVHIIELERAQAAAEQYGKNSTLAQNRLNLEEQSMSDVTNVLPRGRELIIQAGNVGSLSKSDRESIATELAARLDELQDIANRQDGNGEYLFSGYSTKTKPFDGGNGSQVSYIGDQGAGMLA